MTSSLAAGFLAKYDRREAHCLTAFASFLEEREDPSRLQWEYCRDDPPDCWLHSGGHRFAVEVTSTRVRAGRRDSEELVPLESWGLASQELCRQIGRQAVGCGALHGFFGMCFTTKVSVRGPEFRALKSHVTRMALEYIASNQLAPQAPARSIHFGTTRVCSIGKYAPSPNRVEYAMSDASGEEETVRRVAGYICDAAARKAERLAQRASGNCWILLLLNTDEFAEKCPHVYRKAFEYQSAASCFHSVFVVWGNSTGFMLSSRNPNWQSPRLDAAS